MEQVIPSIQFFIIVQCALFLAFISFNNRLKVKANRLLATLISILAAHMLLNLLNQHFLEGKLGNLSIGLGFCYGPLLYLYAKVLAYKEYELKTIQLTHALPAVLAIALSSVTELSILIFAIGIFFSLTLYNFGIIKLLKRYRYILSQTRTEYEQIALRWLSHLLVLQFMLLGLNILSVSFYFSGYPDLGQLTEIILFAGLWMMVSMMIFQGLQHPELYSGVTPEDLELIEENTDSQKLTDELLSEVMQQIDDFMKSEKPYLTPGMTVKSLGKELSLNPKYISQAINTKAGINFSEYINGFKIGHACALLKNPEQQHLTVLDVMLESGFNTKSNFNRAFKAITGSTPFEYRNQQSFSSD